MMKYLVMECHEGYAVLMDENAGFVNAANLNYSVGQTVTDPVIMSDSTAGKRRKAIVLTRYIAAAACMVLLLGGSYTYYAHNYKTYSTVVISSEANIRMSLNKKGKVIKLESIDKNGEEILKGYNGKGKDKVTVANELLEIGISKGLLSNGDTVEFFVSDGDQDDFDELRSEIENERPELNVSVQDMDKYVSSKPAATTAPKAESSIAVPEPAEPIPPAPAKPNADVPPAVPEKPHEDKPAHAEPPEKPQPPEKADTIPAAPEPKAPSAAVVPPAPPETPASPESPDPKAPPASDADVNKPTPDEALPHSHNIVRDEDDKIINHPLPAPHPPLIAVHDPLPEIIPETDTAPAPEEHLHIPDPLTDADSQPIK